MNEKLDIKDSICLPDDFRRWIEACDKLDEGIQVSDPEMQKHIDTYEKHLERENAPQAPGATTDNFFAVQNGKSIKELDTPSVPGAGTTGVPGMGTPGFAAGQPRQPQQPQQPQQLLQQPGDAIKQLKQMAIDVSRDPQMRSMPQFKNMLNFIDQMK